MPRRSRAGERLQQRLVHDSPLRQADPRTRLALSIVISMAILLPLERLVFFLGVYLLFAAWARLLPEMIRQAWALRWALLFLFIVDVWFVGWDLAWTITMRLLLLSGVFALFVSTTTTRELTLALEALKFPYRYAFSLSLAVASLSYLEEEWNTIREAQAVRGVLPARFGLRDFLKNVSDLVALSVPAIVLTTRRAWAVNEAAYARGFDSPNRRPYQVIHFTWRDLVLALLATAWIAAVFFL